jgi:hypothetical protein
VDWLEAAGVESAVTCTPGFVSEHSPRYELGRFVDHDDVPQIVFEAEVAGVLEILRRLRAFLGIRVEAPEAEDDPAELRPRHGEPPMPLALRA